MNMAKENNMILGKPNNIENYVCVNSKASKILHKLGFIPLYREIGLDKIYYMKCDNIEEEVKKIGIQK